jgi:hypothetical protein
MSTSRLPHAEDTSRTCHSGTDMSVPYRSACSTGSGSTVGHKMTGFGHAVGSGPELVSWTFRKRFQPSWIGAASVPFGFCGE